MSSTMYQSPSFSCTLTSSAPLAFVSLFTAPVAVIEPSYLFLSLLFSFLSFSFFFFVFSLILFPFVFIKNAVPPNARR